MPNEVASAYTLLFEKGRLKSADDVRHTLAEFTSSCPSDIRCIFDLKALLAECLIEEERFAEAFDAHVALVADAQKYREELGKDPAPYLFTAINLGLKLGKTQEASDLLVQLAEEQLSGAMAPEWIAETKSWITRLRAQSKGKPRVFSKDDEPAATADETPEKNERYTTVDLFYATDRKRTGKSYPSRFYGTERGELELGRAAVTIPRKHREGFVKVPSIFRLEFSENPVRHVVLKSVTPLEKEAFFAELSDSVETRQSKEIFVYVHGFNMSFDEAMMRAAQIAYDMNYRGVPVVYSWPSRGKATSYLADTAVVRLSARKLSAFLEDLARRSKADRIHLIAHSMGSRAAADALELLGLRLQAQNTSPAILDQLLFAAPDLDADLFREMLPNISATARRVTLYGSDKDWALTVSKYLHGDMPRAGQGGATMVNHELLDSIEMSTAGEDMLAHNYYADKSAILDIATLIWRNIGPNRRYGLEPHPGAEGKVWRFAPDKDRLPKIFELYIALSVLDVKLIEEAKALAARMGLNPEDDAEISDLVANFIAAPIARA